MKIELAKKEDIDAIITILSDRVEWFKKNNIHQWGDYYVRDKYNHSYFSEMLLNEQLFVARKGK